MTVIKQDLKTEALKLALEALEILGWQPTEEAMDYRDNAIEAIREALADSALERMADNERELGLDYMEPSMPFGIGGGLVAIKTLLSRDPCAHAKVAIEMIDAMLAEQPAQRKPLTDEEIWDEVKAADLDWQTGWSLDEDASNRYITFARAIEAAHGIKGDA